jgi:hypothetical protein
MRLFCLDLHRRPPQRLAGVRKKAGHRWWTRTDTNWHNGPYSVESTWRRLFLVLDWLLRYSQWSIHLLAVIIVFVGMDVWCFACEAVLKSPWYVRDAVLDSLGDDSTIVLGENCGPRTTMTVMVVSSIFWIIPEVGSAEISCWEPVFSSARAVWCECIYKR